MKFICDYCKKEFYPKDQINGDKKDNRIENLELLSRAEHTKIHAARYWAAKKRSVCEAES